MEGALKTELARPDLAPAIHPGDRVAVAVGSRGIKNLFLIVKTVVEDIRAKGGRPYIVSAMGSHGDGFEDGQCAVLTAYGITEEALGAPVVTTVDVEYLGLTAPGISITENDKRFALCWKTVERYCENSSLICIASICDVNQAGLCRR